MHIQKPTWVLVIDKKALRTLLMPSIQYPWFKKTGYETFWDLIPGKHFVFLSNFYFSLTPTPILINKQIKKLCKYHELHVYN